MPLLADICRSLVGPDCGAAYPAQIERVLLRILGAEEAAEFGGPADVVAAFKSARLTPGSLVGVCANLPALGGQGAPRGVALAVCFAACFYPRRAYTLEPEELAAHVAAFWGVYQALAGPAPAAPAAVHVLGGMARRVAPLPPGVAGGLVSDLSAADHAGATEKPLRQLGAALYLTCCPTESLGQTFSCWQQEAPFLRYFRTNMAEPPSELAYRVWTGDRTPNWSSVRAELGRLLEHEPAEFHARVVILERAVWNEALRWVGLSLALERVGELWREKWDHVMSGFPYYAFLSRFVHWWKQCLAHFRFSPEFATEDAAGCAGTLAATGSAQGLPAGLLRCLREGYRLIRSTFFARADAAARWANPALANEGVRAVLDDLWYRRLENQIGIEEELPPQMVKTIEARFQEEFSAAAINNLSRRLRCRLWAYQLARLEGWRNSEIRSARRPSGITRRGGDFPLAQETGLETIASLARLVRPGQTLLWVYTAHLFLHPLVEPQRPDPWDFKRWLRELWHWLSDPGFAAAVHHGAEQGNRADKIALEVMRRAPFRQLIEELVKTKQEHVAAFLDARDLRSEEAAAGQLLEEWLGAGLPPCDEALFRQWRRMAPPHWVVPAWYVIFIEQIDPASAPARLQVDAHEAETVVRLARAMRAAAVSAVAGRVV